ncbi:MAG: cupin domain-containing protein [Bacteroidia bacterium]|jgi:hypothetical protein|nr:cupin domain-containing protein [Bacteroidia bacterium]
MFTADDYIHHLQLTEHIEGGAFKEIYRSPLLLNHELLPPSFKGDRHASTAIYFLLKNGQFSAFHRIAADEGWHFYEGAPLHIYEITSDGELKTHLLGRNLLAGEKFFTVIKGGSWFASRCEVQGGFSLAGCTVAPGFHFDDFELADRNSLQQQFPKYHQLITELTR